MDSVETLRSFNRSFTQRIGVLDDSFLGSGRPLGLARLLFEIRPGDGATTLELRRRLGLDSGYLSRMLRSLERDRSVEVIQDPDDGRRRGWSGSASRARDVAHGCRAPPGTRRVSKHRPIMGAT